MDEVRIKKIIISIIEENDLPMIGDAGSTIDALLTTETEGMGKL